MLARKGQSTLEYVIVLTAIIAVVIVVAGNALKNSTQNSLNHVSAQMETQVKKINYQGEAVTPTGSPKEDAPKEDVGD
jgi:Flp pilus assembly pilin Flp